MISRANNLWTTGYNPWLCRHDPDVDVDVHVDVDVDAVRTFVVVADNGHFQAAADELGISQQPVSKRIAALERHLGVALLVRTANLGRPLQLPVGPAHPLANAPAIRPADLAAHRIWVPGIRPGTEWSAFYDALSEEFGLGIDAY